MLVLIAELEVFPIYYIYLYVLILRLFLDYRVGQIKLIFEPPQRLIDMHHADSPMPKHLVYVEWFTDFPTSPGAHSGLYTIKKSLLDGKRRASVIPLDHIHRSVHLIPKFGPQRVPAHWTSENVLDECDTFYVNSFSDRHAYHTII